MFRALTVPALSLLLLAGCAATSLQGSWSDPEYRGAPLRSVFVVGTAKDDLVRRVFEDAFVSALDARGVEGVRSYRHLPADRLEDRDAMQAQLRALGAESVLVSRVVGRRTDTVISPSMTRVRALSDDYRDHWYDDYRHSYEVIHTPATVTTYEVVTVESSLYGRGGELIWTAKTETVTGGDVNATIEELVAVLVDDLVAQGLLR